MHEHCRAVVVGHPKILQRAVDLLKTGARVFSVDSPDQKNSSPDVIPCLPCSADDVLEVAPAKIDPRGGQAAYDALMAAARLALAGNVAGIVTAPLHKAALWQAGHHYPGHTELLAQICDVSDFAMMLYLGPAPKKATARCTAPRGLASSTSRCIWRWPISSVISPPMPSPPRQS